jgi:signal transduction histidine kinase
MSTPQISPSPLSFASAAGPAEGVSLEERSLVRAFALFTDAAASLERSYFRLQAELAGLRHELEERNRDLAGSLEQNRRMRQHLDRILEGLPCGVLAVEAGGQVSISNPEAQRLVGIAPRAELAEPGGTADWAIGLLREAQTGGEEQECFCAASAAQWIAIRRAQLPSEDGGSAIFILRDISEAKRHQQERELLERREALAQMSTVLAHEIRNPLGSLELFAGLLAACGLQGEPRQWVEHVRAGLRTLSATVNNVLHFHSQPHPELAPTDLGAVLGAVEEFLRPLAEQAKVRMELAHNLHGVFIPADRHRLEQVLFNLALNAFRAMPHGGELRISGGVPAGAGSGLARVEVADSGAGIAAENLERIFEPGFSTRKDSPGLGLAVCKAIVAQHDGLVRVASQLGGGTTFTLEFPLAGEGR